MKKLIVIAIALFVGAQAHAQLAADAGYQHAFETFSYTTTADMPLDGFYLGANYNLGLDNVLEGLSFQPGANMSFLFGKYWILDFPVTEVALNIPLQARYTYEIMNDFSVYGLFGPTFQYGLIHNVSDDGNVYKMYQKNNAGSQRNRFQTYLSFGAGMEVAQMIRVNLGFDWGLLNMMNDSDGKIKRNVLRIGVGYIF